MNSIIKISIFFTTLSATSLADEQSKPDKGVIIGPKTSVFSPVSYTDKFVKIKREENIFPASPAYNYYLDPKNRDGVYFVDVLVEIDKFYRKHRTNQTISKIMWDKWNKVDEIFGQLESPKIKIQISALIWGGGPDDPSDNRFIDKDGNFSVNRPEGIDFPDPHDLDPGMKEFLAHGFEKLNYDIWIRMAEGTLILLKDGNRHVSKAEQSFEICAEKIGLNTTRGGVVTAERRFSYDTAAVIASALGIPKDDVSKCGRGFIMEPDHRDDYQETWSQCSKEAFKNMTSNTKLDCLKNLEYEIKDDKHDF